MENYSSAELIKCNLFNSFYKVEDNYGKKFIINKIENLSPNNCKQIKFLNSLENRYFLNHLKSLDNIIIYEYFDCKVLDDIIHEIEYENILKIIKQLLDFIIILKEKNYIYNSLCISNILVDNDFNIKLIDYQNLCKKEDLESELTGINYYISPEYFIYGKYNFEKNSIFSIGVIIFKLLLKFNLFLKNEDYKKKCWRWCRNENCNRNKCLKNFLNNKLLFNNKKKNLIDLTVGLLDFDSKKRFGINEALKILKDI